MKTFLEKFWDVLSGSFWFVPGVMAVGSVFFVILTIWIDMIHEIEGFGLGSFLVASNMESVRVMLSAIVGSLITVFGVVFSITIVSLTLAANQFGPRLIQSFMRDRGVQFVIGVFVSTFIFCLIILYSTGKFTQIERLPKLSTFAALVLTILSMGVLIYFIHHVSMMIQAPHVIDTVFKDLVSRIDEFYPQDSGDNSNPQTEQEFPDGSMEVFSDCSDYIQAIDYEGLLRIATEKEVVIKCHLRPGDFVIDSESLVEISQEVDLKTQKRIGRKFYFDILRTGTQDPEFAISQLVEIAVRALSPGINDPFTAMNCLDRLGAALVRIAGRTLPQKRRYDKSGNLRLIINRPTFKGICDSAFGQIRTYGRDDPAVMIDMLEVLYQVGDKLRYPQQKDAILRHAILISETGRNFRNESDKRELAEQFEKVRKLLQSMEG